MSYKFIFDTSALDEVSVAKLRQNGIIEACSSGRFAFYVTPMLLSERLGFADQGAINPKAVAAVQLLVDIKWQRLFNELGGQNGILTSELEGKCQSDFIFRNQKFIKVALGDFLAGKEFNDNAKEIIAADRKRWATEKENNKSSYTAMWNDIAQKLKDKPISKKDSIFGSFLGTTFESTAIYKINNSINSKLPKDQIAKYWLDHKDRCPCFNQFVKGRLFTAWHYMASEQTPAVGINDDDDIQHLVYLNGVDCIVSNDTRFMKKACEALFPDKDYLSTDQFVGRLKNV